MEPFYSVIIPAYNREAYINRSIDSVLNQEFENWEVITVDDGSTDATREKIENYKDKRIRYIYKENGGASSARNVGIDHSNGKYIAFLDSDDEFKPDHLMAIYKFLKNKNFPVCLVCTDFIMNFNGRIVPRETSKFLTVKPNFSNLPFIQSTAIHREAIGDDRLNEELVIREDHEFLDRIRNKVTCYRVENKSVVIYRHDSNITGDPIIVKKEMEKTLYYYIRTRKRVSIKEISKLFSIYSILTLHYFRKREGKKLLQYFFKMILFSPICLFHFPSLKATGNRAAKLLGLKSK